jgi:hypothetical protein
MSGARGGSQQFAIRLALDGADAVEGGLRRVQATAVQVGAEVQRAGDSTGRALAVIDRGTQAASQGLTKLGGDFAALSPIVDNAGGAIGRLVTALGSGAGLAGALGAVGGAVAAAVALYQNWDTVTRAVGGAVDFLTGRVRVNEAAINDANAALRSYLQLSETAAQAGNRRFIETQRGAGDEARTRLAGFDADAARIQADLARAQEGGGTGRVIARGGASGLVPTDEFGRAADAAVQDRLRQRQATEIARLQGDLDRVNRARLGQQAIVDRSDAAIAGAVADQSNATPGRPPAADAPASAPRGGGGAAPRVDDPSRERDAFTARFDPAERYRQTLESIVALNDRLAAAGQNPLPDEAVLRATEQAMADYQRATEGAAQSTASLADGSKDFERAATAGAKALAGAFEDLVFEGQNFDDVLKNLERSLLRVGNQYLLQPLFQQGLGALFGTPGGGAGGTGGGGIGGLLGSAVGSLFGASGGLKGVEGAAGLVSAAFPVMHDGGLVGAGGGASRMVPMGIFAGAPRLHSGGLIGPNEVPAILERGERVLSRREAAAYGRGGGMTININTPDAGSFRNSEGQIMSRLASAIARSGRNR